MVMAGIPRTKLVKDTQHTHARTIYSHARCLYSLLYRGSSLSCSVDHQSICIWQQYIRNFPVAKQILSRCMYMCMQPVSQTFKSLTNNYYARDILASRRLATNNSLAHTHAYMGTTRARSISRTRMHVGTMCAPIHFPRGDCLCPLGGAPTTKAGGCGR